MTVAIIGSKAGRPTYWTQAELAEGWSEADEVKRRSTWSSSNMLGIRGVLSRQIWTGRISVFEQDTMVSSVLEKGRSRNASFLIPRDFH